MQKRKHDNLIRTFRRRLGYSQEDLARLLGHQSASSVTRHEAGDRAPSLPALIALVHILGVPITALFPDLSREVADRIRPFAEEFLTNLPTNEFSKVTSHKRLSTDRLLARLGPGPTDDDPFSPNPPT